MLKFIKSFLGFKSKTPPTSVEAPYKIEIPPVVVTGPAQCGCGRSATGFCVGLHKLSQEEWAAHPDNPVKPVAESAPAPVVPAVPAAPAKKAAVKKAPAKKAPAKKKPAAMKPAAKPKKAPK